jgi:hypothetical protein
MAKSARSRAEQHFTASQKKDKQDLKEREKAWQDKLDRTATLRALRLAKEAVDKQAADEAAALKAATKKPAKRKSAAKKKSEEAAAAEEAIA